MATLCWKDPVIRFMFGKLRQRESDPRTYRMGGTQQREMVGALKPRRRMLRDGILVGGG